MIQVYGFGARKTNITLHNPKDISLHNPKDIIVYTSRNFVWLCAVS